jgi:hypothetical protein
LRPVNGGALLPHACWHWASWLCWVRLEQQAAARSGSAGNATAPSPSPAQSAGQDCLERHRRTRFSLDQWTYSLPILCLGTARVCMAWCVHGVGIKNRDHLGWRQLLANDWCSAVLREGCKVVMAAGCVWQARRPVVERVVQGGVGAAQARAQGSGQRTVREAGPVAWCGVCAGLCARASSSVRGRGACLGVCLLPPSAVCVCLHESA